MHREGIVATQGYQESARGEGCDELDSTSLRQSRSELSGERRRSGRAADTRAVQVLEGNKGGLDTCSLLRLRVSEGEADSNGRAG